MLPYLLSACGGNIDLMMLRGSMVVNVRNQALKGGLVGFVQAQNGATALHNAAGGGCNAVVKALLAAKADTDIQNGNCNTALHLASGKGGPSSSFACTCTDNAPWFHSCRHT
jgi:ankyrin repeat protein